MASIVSSLTTEDEVKLQRFFSRRVCFHLLYKSSHHGITVGDLFSRFDKHGKYLLLVFLKSGSIRGAFISEPLTYNKNYSDEEMFVFQIENDNEYRFPKFNLHTGITVSVGSNSISFGKGLNLKLVNRHWFETFCTDVVHGKNAPEEKDVFCTDVELHRVQGLADILPKPWREVSWRDTRNLREAFVSYKLESLSRGKALLLGPVGSGKSSFINSIRSTMYQHVIHMPNIGTAVGGFTQKMKTYNILASQRGSQTALSLCDVMALGTDDSTGLSYTDALAVIKGHVPEGYKFQRDVAISDTVSGYIANPTVTDQVHCVLFVLDATKVTTYPSSLESTLRKLHTTISELGIPQLILLTHVDQVCPAVQKDLKDVYSSQTVKDKMQKAGDLVGLPLSYVLPVKNYASQLKVDCSTDILLLSVAMSIVQAVDDIFND